jgi:large subunit ribosomal protein L19
MFARLSARMASLRLSRAGAEAIAGSSCVGGARGVTRACVESATETACASHRAWIARSFAETRAGTHTTTRGFHASAVAPMASRDAKSMKTHKDGDKLTPAPRGIDPPMTPWEAGARNDPNFGKGGGGMSAFTPTARLRKRKTLQKRAAFLMQTLENEKMREIARSSPVTPFRPGDVIRVKVAVLENRGRANNFTGICIARRNRGLGSSFTLRSVVAGVPVERTFPTYSPTIKEFEVLERRKVRRGKLYYLRDKPLRYSRV